MTPSPQPVGGAPRFLSRREVAALFNVSPHTVYRWAREGRLPYLVTPGGRRRYPRDEVERLATTALEVHQGVARQRGDNGDG